MNLFDKKIADTYKGKSKVLKTVRVDKETALKLDKLLDYCREQKGTKVSQNQLIAGIIDYFIVEYEHKVTLNEEKANKRVLELVNKVY